MSDRFEPFPADALPSGDAVRIVVLGDGGAGEALAMRAAALCGGVVVDTLPLDAAGPRRADADLLLICAGALAPDRLAALLDTLGEPDRGMRVEARIDALDVADAWADGRATLLCRPTLAEWVAALTSGGGGATVREDDGGRYDRLRDEVARIAAVLARLADTDRDVGDAVAAQVAAPDIHYRGAPPAADGRSAPIRAAIRARRARAEFFDATLFADPAWDMLLDLYAARLEEAPVSVSSLCIAAAVPPTTALRWITALGGLDLIERRPDPADRRRVFVVLADDAADRMARYVEAMRRSGLPIA